MCQISVQFLIQGKDVLLPTHTIRFHINVLRWKNRLLLAMFDLTLFLFVLFLHNFLSFVASIVPIFIKQFSRSDKWFVISLKTKSQIQEIASNWKWNVFNWNNQAKTSKSIKAFNLMAEHHFCFKNHPVPSIYDFITICTIFFKNIIKNILANYIQLLI